MGQQILTMIFRFISAHVFTFYLDLLAQSPFPGVKNEFKLSPFGRPDDRPDLQEKFCCGDEFSLDERSFQLSK
jgi:hypothetical protein